jgi:UDP-3-O-[3-hydroxymyristoyl] glucosamine N-acyltransferase
MSISTFKALEMIKYNLRVCHNMTLNNCGVDELVINNIIKSVVKGDYCAIQGANNIMNELNKVDNIKPTNKANNMSTITPINKKYNSIVKRFIKADLLHNQAVNAQDVCENDKQIRANERLQERTYNKAVDLFVMLPKREQHNIGRFICVWGY